MSLANEIAMRGFIEEVINNGNLSILEDIIHPNYLFRSPDLEFHGPEGLRGLLTGYRTAFPDLHVEIDDLVVNGDRTAISFTLTGTHEGDLMGIAATGIQVKVNGMILSRLEDGKILEERELLDLLTLFRQLGVYSITSETETNDE